MKCIYCGEAAGFLKTAHVKCEDLHRAILSLSRELTDALFPTESSEYRSSIFPKYGDWWEASRQFQEALKSVRHQAFEKGEKEYGKYRKLMKQSAEWTQDKDFLGPEELDHFRQRSSELINRLLLWLSLLHESQLEDQSHLRFLELAIRTCGDTSITGLERLRRNLSDEIAYAIHPLYHKRLMMIHQATKDALRKGLEKGVREKQHGSVAIRDQFEKADKNWERNVVHPYYRKPVFDAHELRSGLELESTPLSEAEAANPNRLTSGGEDPFPFAVFEALFNPESRRPMEEVRTIKRTLPKDLYNKALILYTLGMTSRVFNRYKISDDNPFKYWNRIQYDTEYRDALYGAEWSKKITQLMESARQLRRSRNRQS